MTLTRLVLIYSLLITRKIEIRVDTVVHTSYLTAICVELRQSWIEKS